ncbi:Calpain-3 [Gryllus bimaculatus]|nr:Calpain-3 [Gryllus bimaculatus]
MLKREYLERNVSGRGNTWHRAYLERENPAEEMPGTDAIGTSTGFTRFALCSNLRCQQKGKSEQKNDMAPLYDVVIEVVQEQNRKEFGKQLYEICILVMKEEETEEMQALVAEQKYMDEDFPPPEERWMRPHELVENPKMFVDGPSHMDIIQENLGDCWFLAVATVVAQHPDLIYQLVLRDPKWTGVDKETRQKLEYLKSQDGQFFMRMSNFLKHFPMIWFASPFPDFGDNYQTTPLQASVQRKWNSLTYLISSSWDADISTEDDFGREVFLKSPQYSLTVGESVQQKVNSEEENEIAPTYDVVIEVVQEQSRKEFGHQQYGICILVMKVGGKFPRKFTAETMDDFQFFKGSEEPERSSSVTSKLKLDSGDYLLIPAVMQTFKSRHFLMRIYSRKPIKVAAIERQ